MYSVPAESTSIYSTQLFFYNSANNTFSTFASPLGSSMVDSCPANTPTWPSDRHPYGQLAIDTNRNRLWMYGGANQTCNGATVNVSGTTVTWQCCGVNYCLHQWKLDRRDCQYRGFDLHSGVGY